MLLVFRFLEKPICFKTCAEGISEGRRSLGFELDGSNFKYIGSTSSLEILFKFDCAEREVNTKIAQQNIIFFHNFYFKIEREITILCISDVPS